MKRSVSSEFDTNSEAKKMKVKIARFWPVPCLLFFLYCLYTLLADSYEILYQKSNRKYLIQFLACVELSDFFPDKTEIDLKELKSNLYDNFNSSDGWKKGVYPRGFELILNRVKFGGFLVFNRKVCLIANDREELIDINLFLHDTYERELFAFHRDTFDFVQMGIPSQRIDQMIVLKKGHPYSDCDESNGRFHCLNECFKRHFRLSRYFYQANETGHILLHFSESNQTIQESERNCFRKCKRENCKLVLLKLVQIAKKPETFKAEPVLSAFDFWLQTIGFIFSFVSLFFDQFASAATKLTRSRVRKEKVKVGLFYLNLVIILLNLAYCGYLCVQVAVHQQVEAKDMLEREKFRNLLHPKTIHLAICVPIGNYLKNIYGKTMWEIEKETDRALDDTLKGIYVSDGERSFQTNYQVHHRKILFFYLGRCFPLTIYPNYQTVPSRPILTLRFKKRFASVYVLSEEENLNRKSFRYDGGYAFQMRIVKRLKSRGCVNYEEKYVNCMGRQNCVEKCIARKFIKRYNRTTFGTGSSYQIIIDRDWFSQAEWNTSQLMNVYKDKGIFTPNDLFLNVIRKCEDEEIPDEKACDETQFERTFEIKQPDRRTKEIDLQFDVVYSIEELPCSLRMALDLLGIQSIFFGFNLLQLFWMVYQFTKPRWRWRLKNKTDKVVWLLICLLFSLGCSWNTIRMLNVVVNGELVPTEHYELAERVQMPTMVFCLRIDQKLIDRNHQLTGRYLERLTGNITTENTFESIAYLNEWTNEWTSFDFRRVERFFLQNMKCFRVDIEQAYDRNQFHFLKDTQILRVNFSRTKGDRLVYFMTWSKETTEFSKISNLFYPNYQKYMYQITHETSLYEQEDRFGFFRRHFPPLPEGDVGDLHRQLLDLQANELHRRTLSLPLKEEHFALEVDEDRFEQLHWAQMQKNRNKRTNLNHRQMFVTNHLRKDPNFESDFSFQLIFLRRIIHFTNEVNYATLTLALLNLLSLWLELGRLDPFFVRLHDHLLVYLYLHLPVFFLRRLTKSLLFSCKWLKKLKPKLYELINPRKEEDPSDSSTSN